jgi:translation initiation factor IF-2
MSKVRINDLARELEVKSRSILDALTAVGVAETKTHSSSIEADEAEKVRNYLTNRRGGGTATKPQVETRPTLDFSHISKPGDAARLILERKLAAE